MTELSSTRVEMAALPLTGRQLSGILDGEAFQELGASGSTPMAPVEVQLDLRLEQKRLHVTGWVRGMVRLTCSRCLEPFVTTLELDIDRFYVDHEPPMKDGAEMEMVDDTVCLEDGIFSPLRMAEEELILGLPMLPLCKFACRGLCPGCGADLNREECRCVREEKENPFSVLKVLKKGS